MVPVPAPANNESGYFPSLERCLGQDGRLISWKLAYESVSALQISPRQTVSDRNKIHPSLTLDHGPARGLQSFLSDESTINVLRSAANTPTVSSSESKAAFETRTAAIHVPQSSDGRYDITQIKDDAVWLSQQLKTDEDTALRIVVLEWQERAAARVLEGLSGSSIGGEASVTDKGIRKSDATFYGEGSRRERLLRLYLSEKEYLLGVTVLITASALESPQPPEGRSYGTQQRGRAPALLINVAKQMLQIPINKQESNQQAVKDSKMISYIQALRNRLTALNESSAWPSSLEEDYQTSQLCQLFRILELAFLHLCYSSSVESSRVIQAWHEFVDDYGFLAGFEPTIPQQKVFGELIQVLISIISLNLLKLPYTLDQLLAHSSENEAGLLYVVDIPCQQKINNALLKAADQATTIAGPAMLAWSVILQMLRTLVQSDSERLSPEDESSESSTNKLVTVAQESSITVPKQYSEALRNVLSVDVAENGDPIQYLAASAVNSCQVLSTITTLSSLLENLFEPAVSETLELHARVTFLELVRQAFIMTDYSPEIISATLAVLQSDNFSAQIGTSSTYPLGAGVVEVFLNDNEVLMPSLLQQAQSRFPYEALPFVNLSRVLIAGNHVATRGSLLILPLLQSMSRFIAFLPRGFSGYENAQEDEFLDAVRLTEDLPLFSRRNLGHIKVMLNAKSEALVITERTGREQNMLIPRGTLGLPARDGTPLLVIWEHEYSALRYLGLLLSTVLLSSEWYLVDGDLDWQSQVDVINLLSTLINSSMDTVTQASNSVQIPSSAYDILTEASDSLGRNQDIVSVVFDILGQELSSQLAQGGNGNVELLASCVLFVDAVTKALPGRVWPRLARSGLLNFEGRNGSIATIVSSIEVPAKQFGFLRACTTLFEDLVNDVVCHAVSRKKSSNAVTGRFEEQAGHLSCIAVPDRISSAILLSFTRTFMDVLQSLEAWNFRRHEEKLLLNSKIVTIFDRIIISVYGFDDSHPVSDKLTSALTPSAKYLVDNLLTASSTNGAVSALLHPITTYTGTKYRSIHPLIEKCYPSLILAILKLLNTLLDFSDLHDTPLSFLERQIFSMVSNLVCLYVINSRYQGSVLLLLATLVRSGGKRHEEPPSIYGHLGEGITMNFIAVIRDSGRPEVWPLLSALVSCRQQWLAAVVLSGDTPKSRIQNSEPTADRTGHRWALLDVALDSLTTTPSLADPVALKQLDFVATAQNHWPVVTSRLRQNHSKFLTRIVDFVDGLDLDFMKLDMTESVIVANSVRSASLIAEILAIYLQNMRMLGDTSFVKALIPKLGFFKEYGTSILGYNESQHTRMNKNFEDLFPNVSLSSFKRLLQRSEYGLDYFYDLNFAADMLAFHQTWKTHGKGQMGEFERANCNLSLVDSQVLLVQRWKLLAIELSHYIPNDKSVQKQMIAVLRRCLQQTDDSGLPQVVVDNLHATGVDLALVILQRLIDSGSEASRMKSLLPAAWTLVRSRDLDFSVTFVESGAESYRSLLRILLLAMQPHVDRQQSDSTVTTVDGQSGYSLHDVRLGEPENATILLEIIAKVVAQGFRSLATQLHEDATAVVPSDFVLITAIFQSVLRIRHIGTLASQISLSLSENEASRCAGALFSWSDKLTTTDNDPIYGELSMTFLQEMSTIPPMAEFLATEGILLEIDTANITNYFRRPNGAGPFDSPQRLHTIWSRGILPLCLNILTSVGQPIAAEVAAFLNSFPNQLDRSVADLNGKAAPSLKRPMVGCITLNLAAEVHTLAMLSLVLDRYHGSRTANPLVDMPELRWNRSSVREALEGSLQDGRAALAERIIPTTDAEVALSTAKTKSMGKAGKAPGESESMLEQRVVAELTGALRCLGGGNENS